MKNLKNNIVAAIVAVATIAGFSAFKLADQKPTYQNEKWFELQPGGEESNPAHYSLANGDGSAAPECPIGSDEVCAILAQPSSNPNQPDLSTTVDNETLFRAETP